MGSQRVRHDGLDLASKQQQKLEWTVQRESENTKKTQGNREIVIAHGLHKKNFDIKEKLLKKSFLKLFCVL